MVYSRILIATDLSEEAAAAAVLAARLAHARTRYEIVFVLPPPWPPLAGSPTRTSTEATLDAVNQWARRCEIPDPNVALPTGSIAREIARHAESTRADLIAFGHKGAARAVRRLLGSTARAVLRSSRVDTLIARDGFLEDRDRAIRTLLVPTDLHPPSASAAHRAAQIAKEHGSEILLAHVIDPSLWYDPGFEAPDKPLEGWLEAGIRERLSLFAREHLSGDSREIVLRGRPPTAIAKCAHDERADLIVIGDHGAGALERAMIGSAAETIVELAPCSVLVVRGS